MSDGLLTEPSLDLGSLRQAIQEECAAVARDPGDEWRISDALGLVQQLGLIQEQG